MPKMLAPYKRAEIKDPRSVGLPLKPIQTIDKASVMDSKKTMNKGMSPKTMQLKMIGKGSFTGAKKTINKLFSK